MRVSLLSFDFGESVVPLASRLASHADVQLVLPEGELDPFRDDLADAVSWHAFSKPRLRQPAHQLRVARRILSWIDAFSPDVVHLQQGHLWFNLFLPALRRYPLVLTVHDPAPHPGDRGGQKTPRRVTEYGFRQADQLIAHAQHVKQAVVHRCGVPTDDVHVIPLAFPPRPRSAPRARGGRCQVLFFGRIWPYKGLEYLIAAERIVSQRIPGIQFVIAGQGEDFGRYRRLMANPDRFSVDLGFIPLERREELFRECDLVVLPYIEATQTGVVPLAYRHGKPVVATTVGGLPEVVIPGRTGELVPPRDVPALADAIVRLLSDGQLRERMGNEARTTFETVFDLATLASRTAAVYERALADRRS